MRSCPNLNKFEGDLEIATEVSADGWLVGSERPANPVSGYTIVRSMEVIIVKTTSLTLVNQIRGTQLLLHSLHG